MYRVAHAGGYQGISKVIISSYRCVSDMYAALIMTFSHERQPIGKRFTAIVWHDESRNYDTTHGTT